MNRPKFSFYFRPARKSYQTFSCFENFVESDCIGSPTYSQDHGAIKHLALLLENALRAANHPQTTLGGLIIVGFSKVLPEAAKSETKDLVITKWWGGGSQYYIPPHNVMFFPL